MALRTRKPTGKPAWPRVLLSGEEGARKSWTAAELSADDRIGGMYWFEIGAGETTADEYGAIPGVKYEIVDHDGTWKDIYESLCEAWDNAKAAAEAGKLPIALTVDAMSGEWAMLCELADTRARRRAADKLQRQGKDPKAAFSPETEVTINSDLWNLANKRHRSFMAKVLTWPGPVVLIAREKQVTHFDDKGNPDARKPKEWTLEAQKGLGFDCSAWVRMTRTEHPEVVKLRSARNGITPEVDPSKKRPDFTLAKLIFDWVGCESGVSTAPVVRELNADQDMPGENPAAEKAAADAVQAAIKAAGAAVMAAGKQLGWDRNKVVEVYAAENNGDDLFRASVEALQEFEADLLSRITDEPAGLKAVA